MRLRLRVRSLPSSPNKSTCTILLLPVMMSIFKVIGDTTLDIGPGEVISIAACL